MPDNRENEARKYQPAEGQYWTFPEPARPSGVSGAPVYGAPQPAPHRSNLVGWVFAVIAVALLVATVVWVGLTTSQVPTRTAEEQRAHEAVQTPPDAPPAGEEGQPAEPANEILVPEFALWAPGTKIQSTDHFPQAGESFTAQSCTVAFSFSNSQGRNFAVTAGHCGKEGDLVWPTNATFATDYLREAGRVVYSGLYSPGGDGVDVGIVEITDPDRTMEVVGEPIPTGVGKRVGPIDRICKTGGTTGYTCGHFVETQRVQIVSHDVDTQLPTFGDIGAVCAAPGDSGGPVFTEVNGRAVIIGIVSGTEAGRSNEPCSEGMENPKRMSYSNVEQFMGVIEKVVPDAQWVTQTW